MSEFLNHSDSQKNIVGRKTSNSGMLGPCGPERRRAPSPKSPQGGSSIHQGRWKNSSRSDSSKMRSFEAVGIESRRIWSPSRVSGSFPPRHQTREWQKLVSSTREKALEALEGTRWNEGGSNQGGPGAAHEKLVTEQIAECKSLSIWTRNDSKSKTQSERRRPLCWRRGAHVCAFGSPCRCFSAFAICSPCCRHGSRVVPLSSRVGRRSCFFANSSRMFPTPPLESDASR